MFAPLSSRPLMLPTTSTLRQNTQPRFSATIPDTPEARRRLAQVFVTLSSPKEQLLNMFSPSVDQNLTEETRVKLNYMITQKLKDCDVDQMYIDAIPQILSAGELEHLIEKTKELQAALPKGKDQKFHTMIQEILLGIFKPQLIQKKNTQNNPKADPLLAKQLLECNWGHIQNLKQALSSKFFQSFHQNSGIKSKWVAYPLAFVTAFLKVPGLAHFLPGRNAEIRKQCIIAIQEAYSNEELKAMLSLERDVKFQAIYKKLKPMSEKITNQVLKGL